MFTINTHEKVDLINITSQVEREVERAKIKEGICVIFIPHATCGVLLNEDESGLVSDFKSVFTELIPKKDFLHNRIDDNAKSHILASILGQVTQIPVIDGRLAFGTWQRIFLMEFDGPRQGRKVEIKILSCK